MPGREQMRAWVERKWRDPVAWTELIQLLKTVIAAVAAWVVAVRVFGLPQAFLAPWSALLVVHATVYRTFSEGARQVGATVVGVLLAWIAGNALGLDPLALSVMLLAALMVGKISFLRLDGTDVAATAVIVLTIGYSDDGRLLVMRFLDTAIGIVVGLLVNLVVWPPLRDHSAARAIEAIDDKIGFLLRDMASGLRDECGEETAKEWVDRTRDIDRDIEEAWGLVRQARESGRLNPRRGSRQVRRPGEFGELLHRIEQAVAEIRSMARTLGHNITDVDGWEPAFEHRWVNLLEEAGQAVTEQDSGRVTQVRAGLVHLADDLSTENLSALHWPEYGGLIVNLRNIVTAMGPVAASDPVTTAAERRSRPRLRG